MSTNPTQQVKQLMSSLNSLLEQAKTDSSIEIDIGEARKMKDALSNLISANDQKQQAGGKQGGQQGGHPGSPQGESQDHEKKS